MWLQRVLGRVCQGQNRRKMRLEEGERCVVPVLCELRNQVVRAMVRMGVVE